LNVDFFHAFGNQQLWSAQLFFLVASEPLFLCGFLLWFITHKSSKWQVNFHQNTGRLEAKPCVCWGHF